MTFLSTHTIHNDTSIELLDGNFQIQKEGAKMNNGLSRKKVDFFGVDTYIHTCLSRYVDGMGLDYLPTYLPIYL